MDKRCLRRSTIQLSPSKQNVSKRTSGGISKTKKGSPSKQSTSTTKVQSSKSAMSLNSTARTRSQTKIKQSIPSSSRWLQDFQGMSKFEQMSALETLVNSCMPNQLRHIQSLVEPLLQKDFISLLPREISSYIISYLSPTDLNNAAQTCRYWRTLCEDNLLWKEKCQEAGIEQAPPNLARKKYWEMSNQNIINDDVGGIFCNPEPLGKLAEDREDDPNTGGACYKRAYWKSVYLRNNKLRYNWYNNRPTAQCHLPSHDEHVITSLQINGDIIATASDDQTVRIWSATEAKCLYSLQGHSGGVWALLLSSDGSKAISGSTDRTIRIWNTATGELIHNLQGHTSTVRCMALHEDILVTGSRDCTLRIWNIKTGTLLQILYAHISAVRCVQFDGKRIVSGSYDYKIAVFDANTCVRKHLLSGHTDRVYSLLLDGARDLVISGSLDTSIRIWNIEEGNCIHQLLGHQSLTSGMQLRGNTLVSANADSTIKVWNIDDGSCIHTLSGPNRHTFAVTSLQFIYDDLVATSSDDGTVKLWDVKNGVFICNLVKLSNDQRAGACIWRIKATNTMLVCAVGSRNGIIDTKMILLDFDCPFP